MRISLSSLDLVFSALFLLFGLWIVWQGLDFGVTSRTGPGSGTFPFVAGLFIAVFSGLNLVRTFRNMRSSHAEPADDAQPSGENGLEPAEVLKIVAIIGLIGLYLFAFPMLGAFLHLPILMIGISLAIHWRADPPWLLGLSTISVLFTVACYFVFEVFLKVLLPDGLLGF